MISEEAMSFSHHVDSVGFANFPNQISRRCIKNGFEFTMMVVGQSGLGKSTFLNTLFMAELHNLKSDKPEEIPSTVKIEDKTYLLAENDVRLKLTVVDTPGFGDLIDNSNCWEPIVKYIDDRFADYLTEETKIERAIKIDDKRIHLCLYFIAPTGHSLKQLDIAFLKSLQDRVNIVPVIAKADTLTPIELNRFKQNIMNELKKNGIQLYEFPVDSAQQPQQSENGTPKEKPQQNGNGNGSTHPTTAPLMSQHKRLLPFAVVGSTHVKETLVGGERGADKQRVRVREYPWGTVEVDNLAHNDFVALRDMIIRNNLIDLIEQTKSVHYENYRIRNLPKNMSKIVEESTNVPNIVEEPKNSLVVNTSMQAHKGNSKSDSDISAPKPAKIPRIIANIASPQSHQQQSEQRKSVASPPAPVVPVPIIIAPVPEPDPSINNLLQVPSIISKVLLQKNGSQSAMDEVSTSANGNEKKLSSNNGQKRPREKKSVEPKKVSDTATKGGYNDVNIEHLFGDIDSKVNHSNANSTDEEQGEVDNSAKDEMPKISQGIPQHDFELPPLFYATKPSSKLGLVLHKAESEGRDYQQRMTRGQSNQAEEGKGLEDFLKRQNEVANKRLELDQDREIQMDISRRILERDKQLKYRETANTAKKDKQHQKKAKRERKSGSKERVNRKHGSKSPDGKRARISEDNTAVADEASKTEDNAI